MSTLRLADGRSRLENLAARRFERASRAPRALAAALLVIVLYASFAHGAASDSATVRVEIALAVVALIGLAAGVWSGSLRLAAPRPAIAGVMLLTLFAMWSGISVLWSVAPDRTWLELNRAIAYVSILCLAISLGASDRRAARWIASGFLTVALAVTFYALAQKLFPGLHVDGIFNLNQAGPLPRLQEPLGYWNALALLIAMAVPAALCVVADPTRNRGARLGALVATQLMLLVVALTYSRGGMIALVVSLAVVVGLSGAWQRLLMWLALACFAAAPPLIFGLSDHSLTAANVALARRETAGLLLGLIVIASSGAAAVAGRHLLELEQTVVLAPRQVRSIGRMVALAVALSVAFGLVAVAFSSRGLTGTASHAWKSFTATRAASVSQPGRLLSVDSENRWVWWKEAAGAFSDRPVAGWGAGSFPVVHLLYRRDTLTVNQPHSVPLQFLAETGIVGTLLALAGLALLFATAIRAARAIGGGRERLVLVALVAGAVAYGVHALYDWDWNMPALTLPALVFLGVAGGFSGARMRERREHQDRVLAAVPPVGAGGRTLGLAAASICACSFVLSAVLPSMAATDASSALVAAGTGSAAAVQGAEATAGLASRLDPLSDAGPRDQATLALRAHKVRAALGYLADAVRREPTDVAAWRQLAVLEFEIGHDRDGVSAATRSLELDPRAPDAPSFAANVGALRSLGSTLPRDSATARPLPRG